VDTERTDDGERAETQERTDFHERAEVNGENRAIRASRQI